jgi:hypothetical protein
MQKKKSNWDIGCLVLALILAAVVFWAQRMGLPSPTFNFSSGSQNFIDAPVVTGSHSIVGAPTISAQKVNDVLCANNSPACGTGASLYTYGAAAGIDPAWALAFFNHESSYGKAGVARYSKSIGNMRCMDGYPCVGGYAYFSSWEQGYQAYYSLLKSATYIGGGKTTIEAIVPTWAPPSDGNDDATYISSLIATKNAL